MLYFFPPKSSVDCVEQCKCSFRVSTMADYELKKSFSSLKSLAAAAHIFLFEPDGLKLALIRCIT